MGKVKGNNYCKRCGGPLVMGTESPYCLLCSRPYTTNGRLLLINESRREKILENTHDAICFKSPYCRSDYWLGVRC